MKEAIVKRSWIGEALVGNIDEISDLNNGTGLKFFKVILNN